ncbi:YkgJ family cysteine cluster protein [Desulfurivibrio dismutans]|uniref:YkgJ family cysteine cluster protein n=1 Tax=Desulfurivibrio dismutans TaxID=1398908 RepID=UPI0023DACFEF|nr:YkgJ family cysteine cluster protein [Desulfurivibrio alkaliphilus]MDF1615164.1 YkgJ family cysteine cluster protein [Desulfurivibrio alkaliphilus]
MKTNSYKECPVGDAAFCDADHFQAGRQLLQRPLLPLVRLVHLLFLTGPFTTLGELLSQLTEPLETAGINYDRPADLLAPHLTALRPLEALKDPASEAKKITILDQHDHPLPAMEALAMQVNQAVLEQELEAINSLLCGPCRCSLCCTGPTEEMRQLFFEIPLQPEEANLMALPQIDTPASQARDSATEPPFELHGRPFYQQPPAVYHWRAGWSMILPHGSSCPQLDDRGGCRIYPARPKVCRRPQIFAYILECDEEAQSSQDPPVYRARHKLLAVWDCPYVQVLQDEIAAFAQLSGLEPIFRTNKN